MANHTKIAFLGATSMSFGLSMLRDVFCSGELRGSTLVLVGRNPATLSKTTELAKLLNNKTGAGVIVEQTTDRRAALDGADFVVNAMAIDRNRLWQLDFAVPRKYGIRHTLGENGGPGGLFFTLRTLPLVFDLVREMEALCPQALFINFANPESRIILALGKYSPIRSLGLCHGIFMGQRVMELPSEQVEVWGAGINHDRRRPLPAAAQEGKRLRLFICTADPPIVPRDRILDDLQRRTSRRISGLRLGGWRKGL